MREVHTNNLIKLFHKTKNELPQINKQVYGIIHPKNNRVMISKLSIHEYTEDLGNINKYLYNNKYYYWGHYYSVEPHFWIEINDFEYLQECGDIGKRICRYFVNLVSDSCDIKSINDIENLINKYKEIAEQGAKARRENPNGNRIKLCPYRGDSEKEIENRCDWMYGWIGENERL